MSKYSTWCAVVHKRDGCILVPQLRLLPSVPRRGVNVSYIALGGIEPWRRLLAGTDEVFLWRATFNGANIRTIHEMQDIAGAIGRYQKLGLDLRGIAVEASGSGDTYSVDAAFTAKQTLTYLPGMSNAEDIAERVRAALLRRFPGLQITGAHFEVINDDSPKHPALDFWLSHTVIWDIPGGLVPFLEDGSPTAAYGRFEGLYRGTADQGISLKSWPKDDPFEKPNGSNGGDKPPLATAKTDSTVLWVAGAAVVAWLIFRKPARKGAAR